MPRTSPDQVLDAAARCVARVGTAKTTLDDIAREAGCARATLYRLFPGKQQVLAQLVGRDTTRLAAEVVARARAATNLTDAVVAVMTEGARQLQSHDALTFVAAHEPEVLLPFLAFERESALLQIAAALVAPAFTPFVEEARAARLAEWVARMTMSYLFCPSESVDVSDPKSVRALVDDFVLPGFLRPVTSQGVMK